MKRLKRCNNFMNTLKRLYFLIGYFNKGIKILKLYRNQDTHNIQAGIYFLSVLAMKKNYTVIQEYLYFISQFPKYFAPAHK